MMHRTLWYSALPLANNISNFGWNQEHLWRASAMSLLTPKFSWDFTCLVICLYLPFVDWCLCGSSFSNAWQDWGVTPMLSFWRLPVGLDSIFSLPTVRLCLILADDFSHDTLIPFRPRGRSQSWDKQRLGGHFITTLSSTLLYFYINTSFPYNSLPMIFLFEDNLLPRNRERFLEKMGDTLWFKYNVPGRSAYSSGF